MDHSAHSMDHGHSAAHTAHDHAQPTQHHAHADHAGHEQLFRTRFWLCLALTIPVLLYTPMLQMLIGFSVPQFPGSQWIAPIFSVLIFVFGGIPFLKMALPEIQNRQPGMMLLV